VEFLALNEANGIALRTVRLTSANGS
jgi:hypothetical protein